MKRYRWLWIVLLAALALAPWGRWAPDWLTALALPGRQTVPATPPAPWTPVPAPPTVPPLPRRPGNKTNTPTLVALTATPSAAPTEAAPTATLAPGQSPAPTDTPALASPTFAPASATPADASTPAVAATPGPWLWLNAEPAIVGPGSRVLLKVEAANEGAEAMPEVVITLSGLDRLAAGAPRPSVGQIEPQSGGLVWRVGDLAPGAGAALELDAVISDLVLPDGAIPLRASLVWRGGGPLVQEIALALPWAPLPAVGK